MGFEEASKKYSRLILLLFGSIITCFLFAIPFFITPEQTQHVTDSRHEWMIVYTVMIMFYFNKEKTEG